MKQPLKVLFLFLTFISVPYFSSFGSNKLYQGKKFFLSDSIKPAFADTSNFLTLPIFVRQDTVPVIPNELVQDRLSCLQSTMPLHYNSYVQAIVNYFTIRNRKYTRRILERQNVYFPLFEKYLAKYNLPDELKYLSVVESALNPKATSWAKAVGLWQFMSPTANDFKLVMNPYIDERMDPEKSTEAACKFLTQLYRIFGDWELALAAYNCGPGNVKKAIARSGGKKTFWEIFNYLPKETRSYVPSFTAVMYTMNFAPEHEIFPDTLLFAQELDTVLINQSLDLAKLSVQLSLQQDAISKLNPAVRKGYLPENTKAYPLKVPAQKREILAFNRSAILDSCRMPVVAPVVPATMLASTAATLQTAVASTNSTTKRKNVIAITHPADSVSRDSLQRTIYVVAKGDNLYKIARQHEVTVDQLKAWNKLGDAGLLVGQSLLVFTPVPVKTESERAMVAKAPEPTTEQPKTTSVAEPLKQSTKNKKSTVESFKVIHAVQPGDTLWNISKRYNNISIEQIKKLNKLKTNEIKPGQKLVLG
ncbi:lytic transglycosylase domain-containing protein [Adhaeribacter aquaticus]|uniref:lytic transglycosylase domain-containing protein n=1 Tax=Adhaeribacter aquaticus TaxID=299567 RepID=UPI00041A4D1E|nr:lytic transglycosylase domain-containing protein [Adhaeribacter aquaticus]